MTDLNPILSQNSYARLFFFWKLEKLFHNRNQFLLILIFLLCFITGHTTEEDAVGMIICPENTSTGMLQKEATLVSGTLMNTDEQVELDNFNCFTSTPEPGNHFFKTFRISVTATGIYTFITELTEDDYPATMSLYEGDFRQDYPCGNLLADSDAINVSPRDVVLSASQQMALRLIGGRTYMLVISSPMPQDTAADFNIYAFADGLGALSFLPLEQIQVSLSLTRPIVCTNVNDIVFSEPQHYWVDSNGMIVDDSISVELRQVLEHTGFPIISDHCNAVDVWVTDVVTTNGDCGTSILSRTFSFTEQGGDCIDDLLMEDCTQIITIRKPNLDDVFFSPLVATLECDDDFPTDGEIGGTDDNPHASVTHYPILMTSFGYQELSSNQCNIGASYSDEPRINICPSSFKFRREWNLIDWCDPASSITYDQIIKVQDVDAPRIDIEVPDYNNDGAEDPAFRISVSPFDCEANFLIPFAEVIDTSGCSGIASRQVIMRTAQGGVIFIGSEGTVVQNPIGDYRITWCVMDSCGNERCDEADLIIRDDIEPFVECPLNITIPIIGGDLLNGMQGIGRLYADDTATNAYDNCGEVVLDIRRNYWQNNNCHSDETLWSPWGEFVDFYCCDAYSDILVEIRATDEAGNETVCYTIVNPEDNIAPVCIPPVAATAQNEELPIGIHDNIEEAYVNDFVATSAMMNQLYGTVIGDDACAVDTLVEMTPQFSFNDCGGGSITRRFEAWQWRPEGDLNNNGAIDREEAFVSSNTCTQLLTVSGSNNYVIDFPQDAIAFCNDECIWGVEIEASECDLIAINTSEPTQVAAAGEECYQLAITYDVINWDIWDGQSEAYVIERLTEQNNDNGIDSLTVESTERPVLTGNDAGVMISRMNLSRALCPDGSGGVAEADDSMLPISICTVDSSDNVELCDGRWVYTQHIAIFDTIVPIITVGEYGGSESLVGDSCPTLSAKQFGTTNGDCQAQVNIPFLVSEDCSVDSASSNLGVSIIVELDLFVVDVNNDGLININEFIAEEGDLGDVSNQVVNNSEGSYSFVGVYPIISSAMGKGVYHAIKLQVEDACGHQSMEIIHFDVFDCVAPNFTCVDSMDGLRIPSGNHCAWDVEASDFIEFPAYDCSGQGLEVDPVTGGRLITKYAIYRARNIANPLTFIPDPAYTTQRFLKNGIDTVYIYGFDEEGNYSFCQSIVDVSSSFDCPLQEEDHEQTNGLTSFDGGEYAALREKSKAKRNLNFELNQNIPNPFTNETMISFNTINAGEVKIVFSDLRGRKLSVIQKYYPSGDHQLKIARKMFNGITGVINYTLISGENIITKRMVLIE